MELVDIYGIGSMVGFLVCIIMLIISVIKKNGKFAKWTVGTIICIVVFIFAVKITNDSHQSAASAPVNTSTQATAPVPTPVPVPVPTSVPAAQIDEQKKQEAKQYQSTQEAKSTQSAQPTQETQPTQTTHPDDYTYQEIAGKASITKYTGAGGVVIIPGTLYGLPVVFIDSGTFSDCTNITAFKVAVDNMYYASINGVLYEKEKVGIELVACPRGLTTLNIPQGVTSINAKAFFGCTDLTSISIPQGVTSIGDSAFFNCTGLTSISIPQGVTFIGDKAFYGCKGLTTINIPQGTNTILGAISIGANAFSGCKGLTTVNIPQGVEVIDDGAFFGCTGLTSINFDSAKTRIGCFSNVNYTDKNKTYDNYETIPDSTTIRGHSPSTAMDYATKYKRKFEVIN